MPMVPGLSAALRQEPPPADDMGPDEDVMVEVVEGPEKHQTDDRGNIVRIEHDDGSVSISLDGRPVEGSSDADRAQEWFSNLVDDISPGELNLIAEDLLRGIGDDLDSRKDWI